MGLLDALTGDRRALAELRLLRRAAERLADAVEILAQQAPRGAGQSFRGFSREKHPDRGDDRSGVSYVNPQEIERAIQVEEDLRRLLGRDPTEQELERGLRGDVE